MMTRSNCRAFVAWEGWERVAEICYCFWEYDLDVHPEALRLCDEQGWPPRPPEWH